MGAREGKFLFPVGRIFGDKRGIEPVRHHRCTVLVVVFIVQGRRNDGIGRIQQTHAIIARVRVNRRKQGAGHGGHDVVASDNEGGRQGNHVAARRAHCRRALRPSGGVNGGLRRRRGLVRNGECDV